MLSYYSYKILNLATFGWRGRVSLVVVVVVVAVHAVNVARPLAGVPVIVVVIIKEPNKEGLLRHQVILGGRIAFLALRGLIGFVLGEEIVVALLPVHTEEDIKVLTIVDGGLVLELHREVPLLCIPVQRSDSLIGSHGVPLRHQLPIGVMLKVGE